MFISYRDINEAEITSLKSIFKAEKSFLLQTTFLPCLCSIWLHQLPHRSKQPFFRRGLTGCFCNYLSFDFIVPAFLLLFF